MTKKDTNAANTEKVRAAIEMIKEVHPQLMMIALGKVSNTFYVDITDQDLLHGLAHMYLENEQNRVFLNKLETMLHYCKTLYEKNYNKKQDE